MLSRVLMFLMTAAVASSRRDLGPTVGDPCLVVIWGWVCGLSRMVVRSLEQVGGMSFICC